MALALIRNETLQEIGNALREVTGENERYLPADMPGAIEGIRADPAMAALFVDYERLLGGITALNQNFYTAQQGVRTLSLPHLSSLTIGTDLSAWAATLERVDLPELESVPATRFSHFTALKQVDLHAATYVGAQAFEGCTALRGVYAPGLSYIGPSAFNGCSALVDVTTDNVTGIGGSAFEGCTSLSYAYLPKLTNLYYTTFAGCAALSEIYAPLLDYVPALSLVYGLEVASFPAATRLSVSGFQGLSKLAYADLPSVESVPTDLFSGCSSLLFASLGAASYVGPGAFAGCVRLESLFLGNVPNMVSNVFSGCRALSFLSLKVDAVPGIYSDTFADTMIPGSYGQVYVPASLASDFRAARHWSSFSENIFGF